MIREDAFILGHRPYAVDLTSFRLTERDDAHGYAWYRVRAVWFRRRRPNAWSEMATVACFGELRDLQPYPEPADVAEFLARHADGRYGGDCQARWDGVNLWAPKATEPARRAYLEILQPMLAAFPAVPAGHDGWWTFHA